MPDPASGWVGAVRPRVSRADYLAAVESVLGLIRDGDIYQANFTFPCSVEVGDDPIAFYRAVRPRAAAGHGALVFTGSFIGHTAVLPGMGSYAASNAGLSVSVPIASVERDAVKGLRCPAQRSHRSRRARLRSCRCRCRQP